MLEPSEQFVVHSITRKEIAEDLNELLKLLEEEQSVTYDDARLTTQICAKYAHDKGIHEYMDAPDYIIEEAIYDLQYKLLQEIAVLPQNGDEEY